ncbi:hypothetical protein [Tahibacter caeni]|uniref:hypothetical protein n=1 Tax=Tahibacter caeni TaxID=1453545 RepID=UPI00214934DE|nr:hypothetical protein [Tahibacter caeni]
MYLVELLQNVLNDARLTPTEMAPARDRNRKRAGVWVEGLAQRLRKVYSAGGHVVFSRDCHDNRASYRISELLFDILVCEARSVRSTRRGVELPALTRAIWAIESEMSNSTRDTVFDFSKLAVAKAQYKLMVIAHSDATKETLALCATDIAEDSELYLATIQHPRHWDGPPAHERGLCLFRYAGEAGWQSSDGPWLAER